MFWFTIAGAALLVCLNNAAPAGEEVPQWMAPSIAGGVGCGPLWQLCVGN